MVRTRRRPARRRRRRLRPRLRPPTTTEATTTTTTLPPVELPADPFTLGVASGDPDPTSVVLWTRLAPDPLNGGGMPDEDVDVRGRSATRTSSRRSSRPAWRPPPPSTATACMPSPPPDQGDAGSTGSGSATTSARSGTHVAAPRRRRDVDRPRFAVANCQNYANGSYAAHRDLAEHEPDFVVLLGDYIYEEPGTDARPGSAVAPRARADRRSRRIEIDTRRYKSDPHLQAAHYGMSVVRDLGRPRGREQLRRPDAAGPGRCGRPFAARRLRCLPGVVGAPAGPARPAGRRRRGVPHLPRRAVG